MSFRFWRCFVIGSIAVERLLPVALVVAACFWLVRWLAYGRPTVRTPGDWAIGLLVVMIPVTLWATALPEVTRPEVLRLLMGLALYYAVANWAGSTARLLLVAAGLAAAGLALAALAPFLGGLPAGSGFDPCGAESCGPASFERSQSERDRGRAGCPGAARHRAVSLPAAPPLVWGAYVGAWWPRWPWSESSFSRHPVARGWAWRPRPWC